MRMRNLVLALVAISVGISQAAGDKALMTRVYDGNDFGSYYLDPPYWSYHSKGFLASEKRALPL
jgi:hypothetical protein